MPLLLCDVMLHCPHSLTPISPPNSTSASAPACTTLPSRDSATRVNKRNLFLRTDEDDDNKDNNDNDDDDDDVNKI